MKTSKIILLTSSFLIIFLVQNVNAQWKTMDWETNNISFKIPETFTIKQNDGNVFTASGGSLVITIRVSESSEYIDSKALNLKAVKEINCTDTAIIKGEYNYDQGGLFGYESYYDAKQNGYKMKMIIAGYKDINSNKKYVVEILYWDDPATNDTNYSSGLEMLRSITLLNYDESEDDDYYDYF
ncbi:MAG: hypothetical protein H6Q15_2592 [Bacteroidetes bacterium]|nr:hypothetical protein [Bacteroidota bacterium]